MLEKEIQNYEFDNEAFDFEASKLYDETLFTPIYSVLENTQTPNIMKVKIKRVDTFKVYISMCK